MTLILKLLYLGGQHVPFKLALCGILCRLGIVAVNQVEIIHDDEANVYVASSPDLNGLAVEAETLDELEKEVRDLVPELFSLNLPKLHAKAGTHVSFSNQLLRYECLRKTG